MGGLKLERGPLVSLARSSKSSALRCAHRSTPCRHPSPDIAGGLRSRWHGCRGGGRSGGRAGCDRGGGRCTKANSAPELVRLGLVLEELLGLDHLSVPECEHDDRDLVVGPSVDVGVAVMDSHGVLLPADDVLDGYSE